MRATTLTTRCPTPGVRGATRPASGKKPKFMQQANISAVEATGSPRKPGRRVPAGAGTADASAAAGAGGQEEMLPLPQDPLQMVEQAAAAVKAGLEDGRRRQKLKLLLPVNEKEFSFMSTEAMDYPCSLKKEFDTCCEVVKLLVEAVTGAAPQEQLMRRIDDGGVEGEPCAVIYPPTKDFLAVVFPTAERLKTLRSLAEEEQRPLLIVNSQWNEAGQVVSDFGIGPWKKAADKFLGRFEPVYVHYEQRIGAPGSIDPVTGDRYVAGGVLRVLRAYPGSHQVFAMAVNGSSQMLSAFQDEPQYRELETLLEKGRSAKLEIFAVAQEASRVLSQPELDEEDMPEPDVSRAGEESLSESQIQALDAVSTRRYLAKLGLPTSGKLSKLKDRLKQALAQEA